MGVPMGETERKAPVPGVRTSLYLSMSFKMISMGTRASA